MGHLVAQAHLLDSCSGVAAADNGGSIALGHSLGNSQGAGSQGRVLKHAHGAVPDNGLAGLDGISKQLHGLGADVAALHVSRDRGDGNDHGIDGSVDGIGEVLDAGGIDGQQQLNALLLGLGHHVLAVVELAVVAQALADLVALGLQEGVGHAAADDQRVDLLQQVGDDVQLVRNLGAAQNSGEGTLGIVHGVAEILDLLLHQVADSGILDIVGHTGGGAVSAVAGAEGVVNVSVGQAGQLLAESGLVLGLLLAETGVLQQNDLAVAHGGNSSLGVLADDIVIVRKGNRLAQLLAQADSNGGQAELGLGAVLRLAQMAAQNDLSAVGNQLLDGRQCGVDAVIVGDNAVLHRDVEVAANQYALAGVVLIVNGLFTQTHSKSSSRYVSHFWRGAPRPKGFILIIRIKPKMRKCF